MATLNPYHPATEDSSDVAYHKHFILRPTFAVFWIGGWCALTSSLIYMIDAVWPIPLVDRAFYFRLYASIGAFAGLLSWFTARLVALSRLQLGTLLVLLVPLVLVILVATQLNPLVAGLSFLIAGTTFALAYLARQHTSA